MWELYSSQPDRAFCYLKLDLLEAHGDATVHDYSAGIAQNYNREFPHHVFAEMLIHVIAVIG